MTIKIRRARVNESERLTEIAHAAKSHWGYPDHWIKSWKDVLTITPEYISNNEVYCAYDENGALGFYALILDRDKAVMDHLWVDPKQIGTGLGKALFKHAVRKAAGLRARIIEIESDPNAEGFYAHMGARRIGQTSSELDGQERILPLLAFEIETYLPK